MGTYIFASVKGWHIDAFTSSRGRLPGKWVVITDPADLTLELVTTLAPRYIFFPHWSSIVPASVLEEAECVCFHMTDVPYGRGGSPLQNLISRGHAETVLCALRMSSELDAGPIYGKRPLSLEGSAREIFHRAAAATIDLMVHIIDEEPVPVPQSGPPTLFVRRTQKESLLPQDGTLERLYDHIRMLDAATYPHAFLDHGAYRLTFTEANLKGNALEARVRIEERRGPKR
jgi:methionyl-tRNA formyltransferase